MQKSNTTNASAATTAQNIQFGKKGRLAENPVGLKVALEWHGRTLLGDVVACAYNDVRCCILLTVRHFNGEDWPIQPAAVAVDVIR